MLIPDEINVPYDSLADWTALLFSSVVYTVWSVLTLAARRRCAERTKMGILAWVIAVLLLATGLALYGFVFLKVDALAYRAAVRAALPGPLTPRSAQLLTNLVVDRAWSFINSPWAAGARGMAFSSSPLFAVAIAAVATRARRVAAV
jgi:hypothetical protein